MPPKRSAESVTIGHPDKLADRIADALLDAYLAQDRLARTAFEVLLCGPKVVLAGEATARARVDHDSVIRRVIRDTGYDAPDYNCDAVDILDLVRPQHTEIASAAGPIGAGDQGTIVGYAESGHPSYLPLPLVAARALTRRLTQVGPDLGLGPDGKALVALTGARADVLVSSQHRTTLERARQDVFSHVIEPTLSQLDLEAGDMRINPAGEFRQGGPVADTGLTGRKLAVDTYGGLAGHGGGAFSGKDPSKVDRSAAYMARQQAKVLVHQGLASRAEVRVAYAIGDVAPLHVTVDTFGPGGRGDVELRSSLFEPAQIVHALGLRRPIYERACVLGHFGSDEFSWETMT